MTKSANDELSPDPDDQPIEALERQAADDDNESSSPPEALAATAQSDATVTTPKHDGSPSPADETVATVQSEVSGRTPKHIGHYHITRVIASGGMGTVYEAIQEQPRRTVALKLMKHGIASRSAMRRFEYESQILARLRHPGIAQVYEAGTHRDDAGVVPFFAMEYIVGAKSLTEYADQKKLGTRQRMKLLVQVCAAVHYGHQKGIIHRDLKPANILVDAHGQVKIIDFGVARGTDSDIALTTLQTNIGQLIGTLQYMSPEQCQGDPHDIDTRSDVYALGVVFYELLCHRLPYDLRHKAIYEATRVIREEDPTKLSTINRKLRGDVETIALKALAKDRDRRYQSAADLSADVTRYLAAEPIAARRANRLYVLRMFVRRNMVACAFLGALFSILILATTVTTRLYWRAETATGEMATERNWAIDMERTARKSLEHVEAMSGFLREILGAADPSRALGAEFSVRELLHQASEKLSGRFPDKPAIEATLRATIGNALGQLGHPDEAEPHLRRAVELRRHRSVEHYMEFARALRDLAVWLDAQGRLDECADVLEEAREVYAQRLGPTHLQLTHVDDELAVIQWRRGAYATAESIWKAVLDRRRSALPTTSPYLATSCLRVSVASKIRGDYPVAERLAREAMSVYRGFYGDHPNTAASMDNLGGVLLDAGDYAEAEHYLRGALALKEKLLGPNHPSVAVTSANLAAALLRQGNPQTAREYAQRALDITQSLQSRDRPTEASARNSLGEIQLALGQAESAEENLRNAIQLLEQILPPGDWMIGASKSLLGASLAAQGRLGEAETMLIESHRALASGYAAGSVYADRARDRLAAFYVANGRPEEAASIRRE